MDPSLSKEETVVEDAKSSKNIAGEDQTSGEDKVVVNNEGDMNTPQSTKDDSAEEDTNEDYQENNDESPNEDLDEEGEDAQEDGEDEEGPVCENLDGFMTRPKRVSRLSTNDKPPEDPKYSFLSDPERDGKVLEAKDQNTSRGSGSSQQAKKSGRHNSNDGQNTKDNEKQRRFEKGRGGRRVSRIPSARGPGGGSGRLDNRDLRHKLDARRAYEDPAGDRRDPREVRGGRDGTLFQRNSRHRNSYPAPHQRYRSLPQGDYEDEKWGHAKFYELYGGEPRSFRGGERPRGGRGGHQHRGPPGGGGNQAAAGPSNGGGRAEGKNYRKQNSEHYSNERKSSNGHPNESNNNGNYGNSRQHQANSGGGSDHRSDHHNFDDRRHHGQQGGFSRNSFRGRGSFRKNHGERATTANAEGSTDASNNKGSNNNSNNANSNNNNKHRRNNNQFNHNPNNSNAHKDKKDGRGGENRGDVRNNPADGRHINKHAATPGPQVPIVAAN